MKFAQKYPHSRLGIAATIIAVTAIILTAIAIPVFYNAFTEIVRDADPQNISRQDTASIFEKHPELFAGSMILMLAAILVLVGTVLGIASLFARERKKLFPILGTVLSLMPIILFVIAIIMRNILSQTDIVPIYP